jgi:TetR/AcrR family transcriptional regulator, mexCD-oprJ operon repressor
MPEATQDHRRAVAARNLEAILDAAERLLAARRPVTISAVAEESGLSRVTVYAHFADRKQLLAAAAERAVERWIAAAEATDMHEGPADEALRRVLEVGWEEISRSAGIAEAASAELDPETLMRSHDRGLALIRKLVERGRRQKVFRTDVPTQWLVATFFALVHAAHGEVTSGRLRAKPARDALLATVPAIFRAR